MSDPTPDNTLPDDLPEGDAIDPNNPDSPQPDQTLPGDLEDPDKEPPGQDPDKVRGRSADAPGHNKPEPR